MKAILLTFILTASFSTQAKDKKFYQEPKKQNAIIKIEKAVEASLLKPSLPESIDVLIWNIYKGKNDSLAEEIKELSLKSDLVLLQETHLNKKVLNILETAPQSFYMGVSFKMRGTPTGVSTGSTVVPSSVDYKRSKRELGFTTPKISLITKYKLSNRADELLVINIHGINFVTLPSFRAQIKSLLEVINDHNGPVLFAGDFNTWSKSKYQFLQSTLTDSGLTEASFLEDHRLRAPFISRFEKYSNPLDNVFVRGASIREALVLENYKGSDHHPIKVKLDF